MYKPANTPSILFFGGIRSALVVSVLDDDSFTLIRSLDSVILGAKLGYLESSRTEWVIDANSLGLDYSGLSRQDQTRHLRFEQD